MNTTNLTADTGVVQMTHRNSPINQTTERRRLRVPKKGIIISQSKLQKRNNELSSRIENERMKSFGLTVLFAILLSGGIVIHYRQLTNMSMVHASQFHSMQESIKDMSMVHDSRFQSMEDMFFK